MAHWKKYLEHFITYETEMMTKRVNKTVINLKKKKDWCIAIFMG